MLKLLLSPGLGSLQLGFKSLIIVIVGKYKPIVCALKNYNLNSREKLEPGPGVPRFTSRLRFKFSS